MPKLKLKPIRINIVEEDGWKNWDYSQTDGISQWSSDNAWDDWREMDDETCQGYIVDLMEASMTKREQKKVTEEDLERICKELRKHTYDLETTLHAITDAHTWAWEEAYTPDDRDIEKAMETTARHWDWDWSMAKYWSFVLQDEPPEGPREWSPRGRWTIQSLFKEFVKRISYERKPGYYDRFMIFDWGNSEPVQLLLEALKRNPEEGNKADVEFELGGMAENYLSTFFKVLEQRMRDNYPSDAWDVTPHWKSMLKDKVTMRGVREEILKFLALPHKQEVEE